MWFVINRLVLVDILSLKTNFKLIFLLEINDLNSNNFTKISYIEGFTTWINHQHNSFSLPLINLWLYSVHNEAKWQALEMQKTT